MLRMDSDRLQRTLLRAARAASIPPGVPEGFEERVLRAIRRARRDETLEAWASGLWRAAISSAGVAGLMGGVALSLAVLGETVPGGDADRVPAAMAEESAIEDLLIEDLFLEDPRAGELR